MIKSVKLSQTEYHKAKKMNLLQGVKIIPITRRNLPYGAYINGTESLVNSIITMLEMEE